MEQRIDRDWLEELCRMFRSAPLMKLLEIEISFDAEARAHFKLAFHPRLCHTLGDVHGGIYATLLDNAGWFTVAGRFPGFWVATSELHTYLLEPAQGEDMEAVGRIVRLGKKIAVAESELFSASGRLLGRGIGSFLVLKGVPYERKKVLQRLEELYQRFNWRI